VHQVFGAGQPVSQDREESFLADFRGYIEIFRKGADSAFVNFEEQSVFAAEVLEDGTFGDAQGNSNISDPGGMVAVLGEMQSCGLDNATALRLGAGTRFELALIERRCSAIAGYSWHSE